MVDCMHMDRLLLESHFVFPTNGLTQGYILNRFSIEAWCVQWGHVHSNPHTSETVFFTRKWFPYNTIAGVLCLLFTDFYENSLHFYIFLALYVTLQSNIYLCSEKETNTYLVIYRKNKRTCCLYNNREFQYDS